MLKQGGVVSVVGFQAFFSRRLIRVRPAKPIAVTTVVPRANCGTLNSWTIVNDFVIGAVSVPVMVTK